VATDVNHSFGKTYRACVRLWRAAPRWCGGRAEERRRGGLPDDVKEIEALRVSL
jgi:hypothetical protein